MHTPDHYTSAMVKKEANEICWINPRWKKKAINDISLKDYLFLSLVFRSPLPLHSPSSQPIIPLVEPLLCIRDISNPQSILKVISSLNVQMRFRGLEIYQSQRTINVKHRCVFF